MDINSGNTIFSSLQKSDTDYKGKDYIIQINLSLDNFVIKGRERISQKVSNVLKKAEWVTELKLMDNKRVVEGFGNTVKALR